MKETGLKKWAMKLIVIGATAIIAGGCSKPVTPEVKVKELMGTFVSITAWGAEKEAVQTAIDQAFLEMEKVDYMMSDYKSTSELSRLNREGINEVKVSEELYGVIKKSVAYSIKTGGAFDITVGPLMKVWNTAANEERAPADEETAKALTLVGYEKLKLEDASSSVKFGVAGMSLDLGGIAKGYALDKAIDKLKELGVENAMVNAGGDVRSTGLRPDGKVWHVAVRDPENPGGKTVVLDAPEAAIATSGDYEKFIEVGSEKYSHLMNPKTGKSVECVSATVVAPLGADADTLATSICVLGPEKGLELINVTDNTEAMIIMKNGEVKTSNGFAGYIQKKNAE